MDSTGDQQYPLPLLPFPPIHSFLSIQLLFVAAFCGLLIRLRFSNCNIRNCLLLIFMPWFIYSAFQTKNTNKVNATDSSIQPLICSFMFSVSSISGSCDNCLCGRAKLLLLWVWLEDTGGFSSSQPLSSAKSPNSSFAALMPMMSYNPKVHKITTVLVFHAAKLT